VIEEQIEENLALIRSLRSAVALQREQNKELVSVTKGGFDKVFDVLGKLATRVVELEGRVATLERGRL